MKHSKLLIIPESLLLHADQQIKRDSGSKYLLHVEIQNMLGIRVTGNQIFIVDPLTDDT